MTAPDDVKSTPTPLADATGSDATIRDIAAAQRIGCRCRRCGYDLRGLPRDHPCPECGDRVDEAAERKAAVEWFLSRDGFWLRRPPWPLYPYLDDVRCHAMARKRWLRWLIAPWLMVFLSIAFLSGFYVAVSEVRRGTSGVDHFVSTRPLFFNGEAVELGMNLSVRIRFSLAAIDAGIGVLGAALLAFSLLMASRRAGHFAVHSQIDAHVTALLGNSAPILRSWSIVPSIAAAPVLAIIVLASVLESALPSVATRGLLDTAAWLIPPIIATYMLLSLMMAVRMGLVLTSPLAPSRWAGPLRLVVAWTLAQVVIILLLLTFL